VPSESGVVYRARVATELIEGGLSPLLEVLAQFAPVEECGWQIVGRILLAHMDCPSGLRMVTLAESSRHDLSAVVVNGSGGNKNRLCVVSVMSDRSGSTKLKLLLDVWHEGTVKYRFDRRGRLIGLGLQYLTWHAADYDTFPGHVYLARNYAWLPNKHAFRHGPLYVDDQAEANASLVELLFLPGCGPLLGVEDEESPDKDKATVTFMPVGLLWRKVPPELRSAKRIRAICELDHTADCGGDWRIVELRPLDGK